MSKIVTRVQPNFTAKMTAFPYQAQAFAAIKDLDYSAIFHEQGLGKTKIAVDLLLYWLQKRNIDTVLIVTKKQLVNNWVNELKQHAHITPKLLSTNKVENFYVLNSTAKLIVTNFETISTDKYRISLFLKSRDVAIIIDESTKLKNPEAKLTQDFIELSPLFRIRTIMTGTPVANRPYDIWSQVFFLDQGKSLGESFEEFKIETDLANELVTDEGKRASFESRVASIYAKISDFSVRETKKSAGIKLPDKEYKTVITSFSPRQKQIYSNIINELEIEVRQQGKIILDDNTAALKRLLRLLQVTSNPRLIDEDYSEVSSKEKALTQLLHAITEQNEKCIVWSSFIENVEYFFKKFRHLNPKKIHGSMSISDRNQSVAVFKEDPLCRVLFATPQAAKEGLTLTVANHVVFYDRGFNLDDYLQAQDRIHRISQTKTCYIYNLIMRDSIDEWIDSLLEAKQYAAFLAQGDISLSQYRAVATYSYGELINKILENNIKL